VGLKMRTVPADLQQLPATTSGASPTQIPWPELFTFRRTGVVEGTANRKTNFMLMRLTDVWIK
jgi:TRAP-type C4-dicarboxylate transport system substrate-binding protein